MIIKPTEKQLKYIHDIEESRMGVPKFTGITIQDASDFIRKYKDYPSIRYEEVACSKDELMLYFDEYF